MLDKSLNNNDTPDCGSRSTIIVKKKSKYLTMGTVQLRNIQGNDFLKYVGGFKSSKALSKIKSRFMHFQLTPLEDPERLI